MFRLDRRQITGGKPHSTEVEGLGYEKADKVEGN